MVYRWKIEAGRWHLEADGSTRSTPARQSTEKLRALNLLLDLHVNISYRDTYLVIQLI